MSRIKNHIADLGSGHATVTEFQLNMVAHTLHLNFPFGLQMPGGWNLVKNEVTNEVNNLKVLESKHSLPMCVDVWRERGGVFEYM